MGLSNFKQILLLISRPIYRTNVALSSTEDVYSIGVEIIFEDKSALNVFMNHPKHYEANDIFKKYLSDPPYMVLTHEFNAPDGSVNI